MPSAQVLDFGPSPMSESLGKFAQGFSSTFFKKQDQDRNDQIFKRIKEKYGPEAKPETIFRDVLEAEGFDQDYKRDLLKEVKDYAALASKSQLTPYQEEMLDIRKEELNLKKAKADAPDEKPITPYQKKLIDQRNTAMALQRKRIEQAAADKDAKFPKLISDYSNSLLKDAEDKLSPGDKAILNSRIRLNMEDEGLGIDDAFNEALQYVQLKNEVVDQTKITPKPTGWFGSSGSPQEVQQAMDKAYQELEQLYEAGIESQKDLRAIAKKGGWEPAEITAMLQRVFQRNGKKLKTASPQKSAELPAEEQGVASEVGGLDDILFGE